MHAMTRRRFLGASAAVGAGLTVGGLPSLSQWRAVAAALQPDRIVPTFCAGCGNHCGIMVHVKNGRPWRVTGNPDHPVSQGKVCARGQAVTLEVFNPDRLSQPLKRADDGHYEPVSWEQAYKEIAAKLKAITGAHGPAAVFLAEHPEPSNFYTGRFMAALGSPNMFTHVVSCHSGRTVGANLTFGTVPGADYGQTNYLVLIGRNPAEGIHPGALKQIANARERGAKVIVIDPRMNNTAILADQWLCIRPATDLALLLAWANVLISEKLYDTEFVTQHVEGFAAFATSVATNTPEWAAEITGIDAATIRKIAREMAAARPKAVIDPSWHAAFGCHYANSAQTSRAVGLVNALLGNVNRTGGLILGKGAKVGSLDPKKYPVPPKVTGTRADGAGVAGQYPLALAGAGLPQRFPELIEKGTLRAGFIYCYNPAKSMTDPKRIAAALQKLELLVVIDINPTETALQAHYILPEPMGVERDDVLEGIAGKKPVVSLRQKAVEPVGNTRPASVIFPELAKEMGLGQYFNFTLDELNQAKLSAIGATLAQAREKGVLFTGETWQEGWPANGIGTPSKKVEFFSKRIQAAGFDPVPVWAGPKAQPKAGDPNSFRMIRGHQAIHTHTSTANAIYLAAIAHRDALDRLWINASRAEALGIAENDWVVMENEMAQGVIRAHVTEGLHPESVWLPSGYGNGSAKLNVARGMGISPNDFTTLDIDPLSGHAMLGEVVVSVRKATAAEAAAAEKQAAESLARWQQAVKTGRRV